MIELITSKITPQKLYDLCAAHFGTMVKFVADVEKRRLAVGGEMHADAETLLLQKGSRQSHLWGGNFYPWNNPEERIEFTSFINIRPMDDNASMEIQDEGIRNIVKEIVESLLLSPNDFIEAAPK